MSWVRTNTTRREAHATRLAVLVHKLERLDQAQNFVDGAANRQAVTKRFSVCVYKAVAPAC